MKTVVDNWDRILRGLRAMDQTAAEVGWFDPEAATIALINDRGGNRGDNPPPRPVLGPGVDAARERVAEIQARTMARVFAGGGESAARASMEAAGEVLEQSVRDAIENVQPPNAPSTIAQKHGYAAPLRGFSPDRIWTRLEHRVVTASDLDRDDGGDEP